MELSGTINRSITLSGSMIARGLDGRGIVSIAKTGTSGLVDTYTITYTDATTSTFTVTNGANGQITATSFAEEFSNSKAYAAGDYVVYSGQLYQFTTAHAAGAWNASHATAVQIADQVSELKSAVTEKAPIDLINQNNLLFGKSVTDNKYYWGGWSDNNNMFVVVAPVVSGVQYTMIGVRFVSGQSEGLFNNDSYINPQTWQSTVDGNVYISVNKTYKNVAFFCTKENYDNGDYGTLGTPILNHDLIADEIGDSGNLLVSQKLLTESLSSINSGNIVGVSIKDGTNLLPIATVYDGGAYYANEQNQIIWYSASQYVCYSLEATQGMYQFNASARFIVAADSSNTSLAYYQSATGIICPQNTARLYVSFNKSLSDVFMVSRGATSPEETQYIWPELSVSPDLSGIEGKIYGKGFARVTGSLSDGESFTVPRTNVKKNNVYSFLAKITSFSKILIGHGKTAYESNYIEIDSTKVIKHTYLNSDETQEYTHGLTLADYIYVQIVVGVGNADISIYSNGAEYKITETTWAGDSYADTFVESVGSTLTECVFTWSSEDFRKPVWMFGDSYFGMTNNERWAYYLIQGGYEGNVLLNSYPGESSTNAVYCLQNMASNYGKPKFIIWCLGMNDGSDSDENTPSTTWKNGIDTVLALCQDNGIVPILATIPTVPTINHEGKNKWVRESGYRYIDFAKAVGASSSGTWYTGMLSSDGVHPTAKGAKALYHRAIADAPEITFSNP